MFGNTFRFILFLIAIFLTGKNLLEGDYQSAGMMALAAGFIVYGYFRYGPVYAASQYLKLGKFDSAEKLLKQIRFPQYLVKAQKTYYHFVWGQILMDRQELNEAHQHFQRSLALGLRTENDRAITLYSLAMMEVSRKNVKPAQAYLEEMRALAYKGALEQEIDRLEKKIDALSIATTSSSQKED